MIPSVILPCASFQGRTCSVLLPVLLPEVNLLVGDGHHCSFFHIKHLPAECLGTKGCFQFRQYSHEPVISMHVPEIIIHYAKRNPFKQPHACCLLHAFIKKARTDLHALHMILFATQSVISLLPQTCAVRHVHHEYDLFRWKCSHQSAEASLRETVSRPLFFSLSSFMARYFPETSCEFPTSSSLIAGLT